MRRIVVALMVLLLITAPVRAASTADEVAALLKFIRGSPCTFIRNGSEYDGAEAADHVAAKAAQFKREIKRAEDFIDRAATKSLLSGEPYKVRCGSGPTIAAADWLRQVLQSYRAQQAAPSPP
jgi:hypothetical protein